MSALRDHEREHGIRALACRGPVEAEERRDEVPPPGDPPRQAQLTRPGIRPPRSRSDEERADQSGPRILGADSMSPSPTWRRPVRGARAPQDGAAAANSGTTPQVGVRGPRPGTRSGARHHAHRLVRAPHQAVSSHEVSIPGSRKERVRPVGVRGPGAAASCVVL